MEKYENIIKTTESAPSASQRILMSMLAIGTIMSGTHGGLNGGGHHYSKPAEFHAKVISDSHTHSDGAGTGIPVDLRALKNARSEGNKNHYKESDKNTLEINFNA